jgi:hypothetical protein
MADAYRGRAAGHIALDHLALALADLNDAIRLPFEERFSPHPLGRECRSSPIAEAWQRHGLVCFKGNGAQEAQGIFPVSLQLIEDL